jgi:hypothetical protein
MQLILQNNHSIVSRKKTVLLFFIDFNIIKKLNKNEKLFITAI